MPSNLQGGGEGGPRRLMKIVGDDMTAISSVCSMGASGKSNRTSFKDRVSPEEWQTRVNLALCYRLIAHFGLTDGIYNHISCRVPGDEEHVLLNPFGQIGRASCRERVCQYV